MCLHMSDHTPVVNVFPAVFDTARAFCRVQLRWRSHPLDGPTSVSRLCGLAKLYSIGGCRTEHTSLWSNGQRASISTAAVDPYFLLRGALTDRREEKQAALRITCGVTRKWKF